MKSIDEIYREFPDEAREPREERTAEALDPRLGWPLSLLFVMIGLGFFTVLAPFCSGISR